MTSGSRCQYSRKKISASKGWSSCSKSNARSDTSSWLLPDPGGEPLRFHFSPGIHVDGVGKFHPVEWFQISQLLPQLSFHEAEVAVLPSEERTERETPLEPLHDERQGCAAIQYRERDAVV